MAKTTNKLIKLEQKLDLDFEENQLAQLYGPNVTPEYYDGSNTSQKTKDQMVKLLDKIIELNPSYMVAIKVFKKNIEDREEKQQFFDRDSNIVYKVMKKELEGLYLKYQKGITNTRDEDLKHLQTGACIPGAQGAIFGLMLKVSGTNPTEAFYMITKDQLFDRVVTEYIRENRDQYPDYQSYDIHCINYMRNKLADDYGLLKKSDATANQRTSNTFELDSLEEGLKRKLDDIIGNSDILVETAAGNLIIDDNNSDTITRELEPFLSIEKAVIDKKFGPLSLNSDDESRSNHEKYDLLRNALINLFLKSDNDELIFNLKKLVINISMYLSDYAENNINIDLSKENTIVISDKDNLFLGHIDESELYYNLTILPYSNTPAIKLIEEKHDINAINSDGETPLHLAVQSGNIRLIKSLLQNKANTNLKNNLGQTPLDIAVNSNNTRVIITFLESNFDNIKLINQPLDQIISNKGGNLLHEAIKQNNQNLIQGLIKQAPKLLLEKSHLKKSPLELVIRNHNDIESICSLLSIAEQYGNTQDLCDLCEKIFVTITNDKKRSNWKALAEGFQKFLARKPKFKNYLFANKDTTFLLNINALNKNRFNTIYKANYNARSSVRNLGCEKPGSFDRMRAPDINQIILNSNRSLYKETLKDMKQHYINEAKNYNPKSNVELSESSNDVSESVKMMTKELQSRLDSRKIDASTRVEIYMQVLGNLDIYNNDLGLIKSAFDISLQELSSDDATSAIDSQFMTLIYNNLSKFDNLDACRGAFDRHSPDNSASVRATTQPQAHLYKHSQGPNRHNTIGINL